MSDTFLKDHEVWGIEDPDTYALLAVALVEPAANTHAKVSE